MSTSIATLQSAAITESTIEDKATLIKEICAKGCTQTEFELLGYLAVKYQLDPMAKQIWAVKYPGAPAQIFTGRDGFLAIAHRSGQFDGMDSGTRKNTEGELVGYCTVWRRDMVHPFTVEVLMSEYNSGRSVWKDKPRTMIQKVAEAQCLRRAFSISGLYSPDEISEPEHVTTCAGSPAKAVVAKPMKEIGPVVAEVLTTEKCACMRALTEKEIKESEWAFPGQPHMCGPCVVEMQRMKTKPAPKPTPAAPKAVAEPAPDAQRDQPSSSPLASEIARINAEQERIDKQVKKPMPTLKPDPHAGITNTCQTCGEPISQAQVKSSLAVSKFALCSECLALMQDVENKKPAVA